MSRRPLASEYPPPFETYISKVPEDDILAVFAGQSEELDALVAKVPAGSEGFRYADGKWSIRELVGHVVDTERIMAYRALCIARGEQQDLPSFDENLYVEGANFEDRTLADLLEEFHLVRSANLHLFRHLAPESFLLQGTANHRQISVRALAFMMAGHVRHHLAILEERYLSLMRS